MDYIRSDSLEDLKWIMLSIRMILQIILGSYIILEIMGLIPTNGSSSGKNKGILIIA